MLQHSFIFLGSTKDRFSLSSLKWMVSFSSTNQLHTLEKFLLSSSFILSRSLCWYTKHVLLTRRDINHNLQPLVSLTCFRPMFHLWINQVVGFYLKWHSSIGVFKHFVGKNQLPGFYISRTLVENGLIHTKNNNGPRMDPRRTSASLTWKNVNRQDAKKHMKKHVHILKVRAYSKEVTMIW